MAGINRPWSIANRIARSGPHRPSGFAIAKAPLNFNTMQQNSAETFSKLSIQRPLSSPAQFSRVPCNDRFAITPQSMSMNLHPSTSTPEKEPPSQHEMPLVDVKSYNERHNKSMIRTVPDCQRESNISFHSSPSTARTNSYASVRTENITQQMLSSSKCKTVLMAQSPSPNGSPKTQSRQWNFDTSTTTISPDITRTHSSHTQNDVSAPETSTFGHEQQLEKYYRSNSDDIPVDDSARVNFKKLNDMYAKRIEDIETEAWGDKDLKICIYQEWIKLLVQVNESFISNMEDLEREVAMRLDLMHKRASSNCRHSQGNELMKCRKDIDTLLKFIRNARLYNKWDLQGLTFETISPDQLLDLGEYDNLAIEDNTGDEMKNDSDANAELKNKLCANMKALAHEVAEKHDEVRELKRQVICLEDEIQKAQKKIQLKDDVIKELRNDLKCANNKISSYTSLDTRQAMPSMTLENQSSRSVNTEITDNATTYQADNGSQFESLSHVEQEEQQKIKVLYEELNQLFDISHDLSNQKMENQRKRIRDIMEKLESEKAAAYRKLDFIRRQLIDLESDSSEANNDCDSGFHSKGENDQNAKLLDAVRKRLRKLNETNCELKKKIQKLEMEKNELANNFQTDKLFSERNSNILKEIADLLCNIKDAQFSYTEIYNANSNPQVNPFREAIWEMYNDFQEKEKKLLLTLGKRNKQNEELRHLLMQNEKSFNEERESRLNLQNFEDIDNTPATLQSTLPQLQQLTVTTSSCTVPPQAPSSTLSTSLTGQHLDSMTALSLHRLVDK